MDDDGLLQDSIYDEDETAAQQTLRSPKRFVRLPSTKILKKDTELSESESDEFDMSQKINKPAIVSTTSNDEGYCAVTPDKWEPLSLPQEIKELFPFILKYTPQYIETPYTLQIFIPEYVPAVGDVDAFLKVTTPLLPPQMQRTNELNEHLRKTGLHFLDEPSGEQSEPSLLNMKLRSILSDPRSASNSIVPFAKSPKDIEKWITEVEQVHMTQLSGYDVQPRKDIDALILDWPHSFAGASDSVLDVYQRCQNGEITLNNYIHSLCQVFGVEGPAESQADFILNIQTLFALYLAASQAWE